MDFVIHKNLLHETLNEIKPIVKSGVVHIIGCENHGNPALKFIGHNKHATIIRAIQTNVFHRGIMSMKIDHALKIGADTSDLFLCTMEYNEGDEYITTYSGGSRLVIKRAVSVKPPKALPLCCESDMPFYSVDCLEISEQSKDYLEMVIETLDNPSVVMNEKFVKVYSRDTEFYAPRVAVERLD